MSTQSPDLMHEAPPHVMSCEMFEQELRQARILLKDRPFDYGYPRAMLKVSLHLPAPAVLPKSVENYPLRLKWDRHNGVPGSNHEMSIVTAHRAYPNRDIAVLTFTLPMAVWEHLQHSETSQNISLISLVAEPDVVGDSQLTHLLVRAARRVNEGSILGSQLEEDLERARRAGADGLETLVPRNFPMPRVMFSVRLRTDKYREVKYIPDACDVDMQAWLNRDTPFSWAGLEPKCQEIHLKFISETPCDGGSEVTYAITKRYWPYLEATSEVYRFVRYLNKREYRELSPNCFLSPSPPPEPQSTEQQEPQTGVLSRKRARKR
ncbi:hypothetical protein D6D13_09536 [Aureobasidium pullulans]|uniref:Uncharacterized protein n=1 Tax=Aureobasidium pullulans TaxID=5580 RepID=A0A4S9C2I1_AURPU|nr:hypothetical protein D6D13_09536 [Aureobasidium pullulans]